MYLTVVEGRTLGQTSGRNIDLADGGMDKPKHYEPVHEILIRIGDDCQATYAQDAQTLRCSHIKI